MNHILVANYSQNTHSYACVYYIHSQMHLESKAHAQKHIHRHLLSLNQDALFTGFLRKGNKLECISDWLSKTKTNPVPGSSDLLQHLDSFTSFHWASGFFSQFLVLLLTHTTVRKRLPCVIHLR